MLSWNIWECPRRILLPRYAFRKERFRAFSAEGPIRRSTLWTIFTNVFRKSIWIGWWMAKARCSLLPLQIQRKLSRVKPDLLPFRLLIQASPFNQASLSTLQALNRCPLKPLICRWMEKYLTNLRGKLQRSECFTTTERTKLSLQSDGKTPRWVKGNIVQSVAKHSHKQWKMSEHSFMFRFFCTFAARYI